MAHTRTSGARFAVVMKWIGVAAALLSFGSAALGFLRAQADFRERARVISEQLAAGRAQQVAGDYSTAWESMLRADAAASVDGVFAKLLGGLSAERRAVRTAQEDLAMEWVRDANAPQGHTFSEISDKVTGILSAGANAAIGARKADLLGHLGWAYFLKQREGDSRLRPDVLYREGVAADVTNPYANVFWGHLILWTNGSLAEGKQHFAAALSTGRARATVRQFQLAALRNSHSDDIDAEWWRVVDEMYKQGEPLDERSLSWMRSQYYFALDDNRLLEQLFAAVPPADHVELQRMLLGLAMFDAAQKLTVKSAMAVTLEAADRPAAALAAWRDVETAAHGDPTHLVLPRARAAILRLSTHLKNDH